MHCNNKWQWLLGYSLQTRKFEIGKCRSLYKHYHVRFYLLANLSANINKIFSCFGYRSVKTACQNLAQPNKNISDAVDVRQELDLRIGKLEQG